MSWVQYMNCEQGSSILNTDVYKIKNISNHRCACLYESLGGVFAWTLAVKGAGERQCWQKRLQNLRKQQQENQQKQRGCHLPYWTIPNATCRGAPAKPPALCRGPTSTERRWRHGQDAGYLCLRESLKPRRFSSVGDGTGTGLPEGTRRD